MGYAHFGSDCVTSLADLQLYMHDMVNKHGFSRDPHRQMTCLVEEVGELARVVKEVARGHLDPADFACREEFADVLIALAGLANLLGVELTEAFEAKAAVNASRTWDLGTEKETV